MELGELGGKLLADTLPLLVDDTAVWTEQDESLVTHAAKISKQEMRLDPQMGRSIACATCWLRPTPHLLAA